MDATAQRQPEQSAQQDAASGGDELKLVVSEETGTESSESGSAGGDSELPGGVDAGTAVAMEELESARRENDELNSRVEDLQDQVQTLQRLLELKNTQLAEMQQATDAEPTEPMSHLKVRLRIRRQTKRWFRKVPKQQTRFLKEKRP